MKEKSIIQFLQYILVGGVCTSIDFVILYLLTTQGGIHYLISSSISFSIAVLLNWLLCTFWVFHYHKIKQQSKEFMYYVLISLVGLLINASLMWFFTEICDIWFMFSKLFSACVTLFYNFFARKILLHSK